MVDWGTFAVAVAVGAPGYLVTTATALGLVGKAPMRFRRFDVLRAHEIVEREQRETQLTALAKQADLILAAVTPNGGKSLMDVVTRVEKKLDDHITSSDKVEAAVYDQLAEQGNEIDALTRKVRDLFTKRGPEAV